MHVYPSRIRVSKQAEECYVRKVREAVMVHGRNISRQEILLSVAKETAEAFPNAFSCEKFAENFNNEAVLNAFRNDLQKVRYHQVCRFPTITMSSKKHSGIIITGFRPYEVLLDALYVVAPELK